MVSRTTAFTLAAQDSSPLESGIVHICLADLLVISQREPLRSDVNFMAIPSLQFRSQIFLIFKSLDFSMISKIAPLKPSKTLASLAKSFEFTDQQEWLDFRVCISFVSL